MNRNQMAQALTIPDLCLLMCPGQEKTLAEEASTPGVVPGQRGLAALLETQKKRV
jgi:hypothetical protein